MEESYARDKKYGCLVCYISYLVFQCVIEEMECCVMLKVGTDEMQYVTAVEGLDVALSGKMQ